MCTRGAHHSARLGRDSLAVFQKDRVSAGRWHAPGSVNLNRVLRFGWANHVSQESCSCRETCSQHWLTDWTIYDFDSIPCRCRVSTV